MSIHTHDRPSYPRPAPLAISVAAALTLAFSAARGDESLMESLQGGGFLDATLALLPYLREYKAVMRGQAPNHPAASHQVINCNSSGPGSLSAVIADPMTGSGDIVDLTPLKMVCSKISTSGATLVVHQDNLLLQGPGAKYLTIDGGNNSRVFRHFGTGTLAIADLTISNGYYSGPLKPIGGCLYSGGNVSLIAAVVSHCTVVSTSSNTALGGGVYTYGNLHLLNSTITDSFSGADTASKGGGAYIHGDFTALYSTISDNNVAATPGNGFGFGGGAAAAGNVDIENSTISGNKADAHGALTISGGAARIATIIDSTVSSNIGGVEYGGIWTNTPLTLANSTVAFNRSPLGTPGKGDGLYSRAALTLQSTIIADNSGLDGPNDLGGSAVVTGTSSNNLVVASTLMLPMDTIGDCPRLDALANNGGDTLTHGLKPASPASDKGAAAASLTIDQRSAPRITGPQADIGAVEWQPSDKLERILASGFDGLCDQ